VTVEPEQRYNAPIIARSEHHRLACVRRRGTGFFDQGFVGAIWATARAAATCATSIAHHESGVRATIVPPAR
jgi:hypothetical protein